MSPAIQTAIAAALLHFIWEGAAIAIVLGVLLRLLNNPRARYAAAGAAIIAMPVVFAATFRIALPLAVSTLTPQPHLASPAAAILSGLPFHAAPSFLSLARNAMRGFIPFWIAGIFLCYLHSTIAWIAVRRVRGAAVAPAIANAQQLISRLALRLGVTQTVALLESRAVDVPVVAGFLRPVILLPAGCLAGMPAAQLEYILLHELAHVRRWDYFVNLVQKAIEGLLFYHPAVWWVSNVIRREREHCCDDIVLSIHPEPREYALTLANLARSRWSVAPAASGGDLTGRIRRILAAPPKRQLPPAPAIALILLAACALISIGAIPSPAPAPQVEANAFERWVRDDVAYIITKEERAAYRGLQTDAEREHFIEQFWERRNPAPGSASNPFKEEHYRRIAYANEHFTSGIPGWKTDRGRIYITFGPPNEIDSHPSCGADARPYEQWRYRFIDGIGQDILIEFDDPGCKGEYHMTRDPQAQ